MDTKKVLKLEGVSKSFPRTDTNGITQALNPTSLTIEDGEFVSIVGPSGCGKSTIMRMLAGLIPPTTGELSLNGEIIEGASPNRGMMFQKPTLFPWLTVEQNVSFSLKAQGKLNDESNKKVDEMLKMIGLDEFRNAYPHHLSGGMAQRVALIRSMINEPDVFLLDEPLGALDAFTRMSMQDELLNMWIKNRHIMVMVTHDVDEAIYMSTRVLVMEPRPGRIREDIKIELEYPRNRTSAKFLEYRKMIMEMLDFGKAE